MSYVYLARDRSLFERSCVVKEIKERIQSEAHRQRLEEEALRMAKLSHPGIAMILDHFVEQGHYFLVVEHIRGKSLSEVSKERGGQLQEDEVVRWGVSICDVIAYIHNEGIIHRDISPDNIMLTEEGSIKFIDFGTSRELRYIPAGKTAGMGKYGYTPPEQWQGKPGPQSDIFALGATLYYLLTGFLPLSKSYLTGHEPQKEDFFPKFPPIRSRNRKVSPPLEAVLQKALQLDANKRYGSVIEMREALRWTGRKTAASEADSPETVVMPDSEGKVSRLSRLKPKRGKPAKATGPKGKAGSQPKRTRAIEFSEAAIRRKTISDVVQHPATLLPLAVCVTSAGYFLLLAPIYGGVLGTIIIIAISGIAALASFSSLYPKQYQKNAREMIDLMEAEREELEQAELNQVRETLQTGFMSIASAARGTNALDELSGEYEELRTALAQQRFTDPLSVSVIPALAEETYRRGLSVLSDALDLMNVLHTPSREKLEREIMVAEEEVEALQNDQSQAERLKLKQEVLASLKERLGAHSQLQLWVEQLLFQAQRCEASLHAARVELATVRAGSSKTSVDSVVATLQERINQVKEVQEELTRMGF